MERNLRFKVCPDLPRGLWALALALLLLPGTAFAIEVSFSLVRPDRSRARTGTVDLYREGSTRIEATGQAGSAVEVTAGHWWWVAETPGYVSVDSETHELGGARGEKAKVFIVPVVPACTLTLAPDPRWKTVSKIAVISLHYGTLYPLDPNGKRKSVAVPEGAYVVYAVGPHGRNRLAPPATCHAFETKPLAYP